MSGGQGQSIGSNIPAPASTDNPGSSQSMTVPFGGINGGYNYQPMPQGFENFGRMNNYQPQMQNPYGPQQGGFGGYGGGQQFNPYQQFQQPQFNPYQQFQQPQFNPYQAQMMSPYGPPQGGFGGYGGFGGFGGFGGYGGRGGFGGGMDRGFDRGFDRGYGGGAGGYAGRGDRGGWGRRSDVRVGGGGLSSLIENTNQGEPTDPSAPLALA